MTSDISCPDCKHENHGTVACLIMESYTDHPCLCGVYALMKFQKERSNES